MGNAVHNPLSQAQHSHQNKEDSCNENGCQGSLPGEAQSLADDERDERIFPHVRRDGERPVGIEGHEVAPGDSDQRRGDKRRAFGNSRGRYDCRVNYHNVRHGRERCDSGNKLAGKSRAATIEIEVSVEPAQDCSAKHKGTMDRIANCEGKSASDGSQTPAAQERMTCYCCAL